MSPLTHTIRSFHLSRVLHLEWTRNSLRKIKKERLVQLAKERHLPQVDGTKNELIQLLLASQRPSAQSDSHPSPIPSTSVSMAEHSLDQKAMEPPLPKTATENERVKEDAVQTTEKNTKPTGNTATEGDSAFNRTWVQNPVDRQPTVQNTAPEEQTVQDLERKTQAVQDRAWKTRGEKQKTGGERTTTGPWMNGMIGSCLLVWYVGGQEGMSQVWQTLF
ncbi:hypothetical protein BY458DRAFT_198454 [Sporodiniella umbellata]|nr:hypothetical protein BY458DRAFT_198454 [Sporodiniella umbellata]